MLVADTSFAQEFVLANRHVDKLLLTDGREKVRGGKEGRKEGGYQNEFLIDITYGQLYRCARSGFDSECLLFNSRSRILMKLDTVLGVETGEGETSLALDLNLVHARTGTWA